MDQPPPLPESQPAAPSAPAMSLGARLFNIFAAPGEVFEAVRTTTVSAANWVVPALLIIAISWAGAAVIFSQESIKQQLSEMTSKAIEKQVEKKHLSHEQAEQAREIGTKYGAIGAKVSAVAVPVLWGFASPFWGGLIVWLVGAKVFKGNFAYMKAVEVAGLANMIGVLDAVVKTLLVVGTGNLFASPSLILLVKEFDPQNTLHSLLAALNLMTFWLLGVRSVGLARLSGVSFGRAAAWIFGIWVVLTGLFIGFGAAMRTIFAN